MAMTTDIGGRVYERAPDGRGRGPSRKAADRVGDRRDAARYCRRMRVAMLTGGGDCPGLNAVMRAVVRKGERVYGDEMLGLRDGWRGAVEGHVTPLSVESFRGTLPRGGTI